jgi:Beta-lactamase class C and other penicillin binding proteins
MVIYLLADAKKSSGFRLGDPYSIEESVQENGISLSLTAVFYFASLSSVYKINKHSIVNALQNTTAVFIACVMLASLVQSLISSSAEETGTASAHNSESIYPIASISKVYTAAAIMKLVEENQIDLDTLIVEYFPEFCMTDECYTKITARMLSNHSAGLPGSSGLNNVLLGDMTQHKQVKQSFMEALSNGLTGILPIPCCILNM